MSYYDAFAEVYDQAMGDMTQKIEFLKSMIRKYSPNAKSVLELACGTGTILKGLSADFDVAGLDLSARMIEVAKKKLPGADIREGDMTNFAFGKSFDVVLCVFDSINHLPDWESWQAVFAQAHEHLDKDGLFIFDFNPEKRLEYLTTLPASVAVLADSYMITVIKRDDNRYFFEEKFLEKRDGETYTLHQENVYEIAFPVDRVKDGVSKNFEILEVVNNKGLAEDNPNWRPFFVCRKK